MTDTSALRSASAAVFGNEKLAEVIHYVADQELPVTAQMVSTGTHVNYSLVRDALRRLVSAGVLTELPRTGGSRSPLYYQIVECELWRLLTAVASELNAQSLHASTSRQAQ
jgi:ribosomal protein S25